MNSAYSDALSYAMLMIHLTRLKICTLLSYARLLLWLQSSEYTNKP